MANKSPGGRPKLYRTGEFKEVVSEVLPQVKEGVISQNKAAKELGISVRSFKRYLKEEGMSSELAILSGNK